MILKFYKTQFNSVGRKENTKVQELSNNGVSRIDVKGIIKTIINLFKENSRIFAY